MDGFYAFSPFASNSSHDKLPYSVMECNSRYDHYSDARRFGTIWIVCDQLSTYDRRVYKYRDSPVGARIWHSRQSFRRDAIWFQCTLASTNWPFVRNCKEVEDEQRLGPIVAADHELRTNCLRQASPRLSAFPVHTINSTSFQAGNIGRKIGMLSIGMVPASTVYICQSCTPLSF